MISSDMLYRFYHFFFSCGCGDLVGIVALLPCVLKGKVNVLFLIWDYIINDGSVDSAGIVRHQFNDAHPHTVLDSLHTLQKESLLTHIYGGSVLADMRNTDKQPSSTLCLKLQLTSVQQLTVTLSQPNKMEPCRSLEAKYCWCRRCQKGEGELICLVRNRITRLRCAACNNKMTE